MDRKQQLKIAMFTRVSDFLRAHPFGDDMANAVAAKFEDHLAHLGGLIAQELDGRVARKAESARHGELRRRITRVPLRQLAGIARGLDPGHAQLAAQLMQPVSQHSRAEFQAVAESILTVVEANNAALAGVGMAEGTVQDLRALLGAYAEARQEADAGRRAHVGARAELRATFLDTGRILRQLDGMVTYRHRDEPELLAAWKSARNVAWPLPEAAKPVKPSRAEGSAA